MGQNGPVFFNGKGTSVRDFTLEKVMCIIVGTEIRSGKDREVYDRFNLQPTF